MSLFLTVSQPNPEPPKPPAVPSSVAPANTIKKPATKKGGSFKKIGTWVVVVVVIGLFGFWGWGKMHPSTDGNVITATVAKGDIIQTVTATGSVTAQTGAEVHVGSQIVGQIKRLSTDVGSFVKAGQIVAELDLPDLKDQLNQSQAALNQAESNLVQQQSGVQQVVTQTASSLDVAAKSLVSSQKKLLVAKSNLDLQQTTTPTDIRKAKSVVSTANSVLLQTRADTDLEVNTAQEALVQAQANATNADINLVSAQTLFAQGFSAKTDLDTAKALDSVDLSLVRAAVHNLGLVKQKVAADLQAASDAVSSAKAALAAANSESTTVLARAADVGDATAAVGQAQANLKAAMGNSANDPIKKLDVIKASEAVTQAKALVAYSQAELNKSFIRSPISGTVLQLSSQQGETVSAGLTTQTLLIVADLKRMEVDAYVDETDIGRVKLGQAAQCTISAYVGKTYTGKVTKIASGSTIQQGVVTYDVTITIYDPAHELKPDMTSQVTIQTGVLKNVLMIPQVAVQLSPTGSYVNLLQNPKDKTKITAQTIQTGGTDGLNIEIKNGLNEGQVIVLAGGSAATPAKKAGSPFGGSSRGGPGGR